MSTDISVDRKSFGRLLEYPSSIGRRVSADHQSTVGQTLGGTFGCRVIGSVSVEAPSAPPVQIWYRPLSYRFSLYLIPSITCLLNLILFAISIHTPKISRQSFRYVTFGDEQTVHLTLSLKKGKCMVFKPRQVQDVRIVKFKELLVINILIVRV